ncbi:hypothetical protein F4803DRAFT_534898 [Xylaria telfairii]|nr:hypothetical protein F4803DRAFT_534898 [Xylaria telfairii]
MSTALVSESEALNKASKMEDDCNEIKEDLKKIVTAVQSLIPQPKPVETERKFECDPGELRRQICPTPKKLEFYVDLLLRMFTNEVPTYIFEAWNQNKMILLRQIRLPSFGDNLTVPFAHSCSPTDMSPEFADRFRQFLMSTVARPTDIYPTEDGEPVGWLWVQFEGLSITIKEHKVTGRVSPWHTGVLGPSGESIRHPWHIRNCGYGTISRVKARSKAGILSFRTINLILAQIGRFFPERNRTHYPLMYYLRMFTGPWPSRNERPISAWETRAGRIEFERPFSYVCFQIHLRCFEAIESLEESLCNDGLKCDRERGQIAAEKPNAAPFFFEERRISVFGLLSRHIKASAKQFEVLFNKKRVLFHESICFLIIL